MVEPKAEQAVVEPPAPEVDIVSLQSKLTKLETELEQTKKGLSTAHQTLTLKDRELKSQADLRAEVKGIREDMELLAVGFATRDEFEPTDDKRQNVLAELQKRRAASEVKLRADTEASARQEYNQRADAVYAQAQSIFGEGQEEKLEDIEDLLRTGNLARAEQRITRASKGKTTVTEPPKETDNERIAKGIQAELTKRGLLDSDTGSPGGVSLSEEKIKADYIANPDNPVIRNSYLRLRKEKGF